MSVTEPKATPATVEFGSTRYLTATHNTKSQNSSQALELSKSHHDKKFPIVANCPWPAKDKESDESESCSVGDCWACGDGLEV